MELEIPTVLLLSKSELVAALVYIPPSFNAWWSPDFQKRFVAHMAVINAEEAIRTIADAVTSYGQNRLRSDGAPAVVVEAATTAVERLWPNIH